MNEEYLLSMYLIFMCLNVFVFIVGMLMAIFSEKLRPLAVKLIIGSVISFVIGFGGCLLYISVLN